MSNKINQMIPEFQAEAFHQGAFKTITSEDVKAVLESSKEATP